MDNEKEIFDNQASEVTEEIEETIEEVLEEAVEDEETVDMAGDAPEVAEEPEKKVLEKVYLCDVCGVICEGEICPECGKELTKEEAYICKSQVAVEKARKLRKIILSVIIAVAVIVGVVFAGLYIYKEVYNPYNHGKYKDLAFGDTMGEIAEELGMDFEELLESNGLPKDMGKSTYERVAINYIPVKAQAEQYGMTVQEFVEQAYGLEGEFDEDITRGELEEQLTVGKAFGLETEEDLASFKEEYGLDESVTLETKFAEVRRDFYKAQYEQQKKAEEEAKALEEAPETAETPEETPEEVPVEETAENAEETAEAATEEKTE